MKLSDVLIGVFRLTHLGGVGGGSVNIIIMASAGKASLLSKQKWRRGVGGSVLKCQHHGNLSSIWKRDVEVMSEGEAFGSD
jgi:hypothetical protein